MSSFAEIVRAIPKVELHLHLEGCLEPEMAFNLAKKNKMKISCETPEELRQKYKFGSLQDFLDIYFEGVSVLQTEEDFYDLTISYFQHAHDDGVVHAELFFDPQAHTRRGIEFKTVVEGIHRAQMFAEEKFGITSKLIMCFLRDETADSANATLDTALSGEWKNYISAVGLDAAEVNNPPSKFKAVFQRAQEEAGWPAVAHAGEEAGPDYIWEALNDLKARRIDHGIQAIKDPALVSKLAQELIPLTVCPLSNAALQVVKNLSDLPLDEFLSSGVRVVLNSDDPAYFGGYILDTYLACAKAFNWSIDQIIELARNGVRSTLLPSFEAHKLMMRFENEIQQIRSKYAL